MMNGTTSLIMMKADVLSDFDTIKVCVGYWQNGRQIDYFPMDADADNIKPVYREFPGWKCDITGCRTYDELPQALKDYILFIEQETGVYINIISVGPNRDATIIRSKK